MKLRELILIGLVLPLIVIVIGLFLEYRSGLFHPTNSKRGHSIFERLWRACLRLPSWLWKQRRYILLGSLLVPLEIIAYGLAGWKLVAFSSLHLVVVMPVILLLLAPKRPWTTTEPTTRVVDMDRGDYPTITTAIEAANPGDRILVRPGLYQEGLVMDKPLEIIGEGSPGNVVVQARGKNALLFQTTMGLVANLTLQQMEDGEWHCVDISQGRLYLRGCDITSQSRACVAIHGGADPRLRCNRIHGGKFSGVYVYDNGQGILLDNDIFENDRCGVKIDGGNLTLCHNRINENGEDGVYVYDNGQGVLVDNDIFGNAHDGVEIRTGSNLTLRHNRINRNGRHAVWVYDKGAGIIEDNDLHDNVMGAWNISPDSDSNVRRARNLE